MTFKHASIVPLIGGETLGQINAFGTKPDYLLSYTPFSNNDSHLVNYLEDVPYILLDQGGHHPHYVDIVNAVCPCAGLSSLSPSANSDAAVNDWLTITAKYVLEEMKPKVFWGENAPRFAGEMGKPIVVKLHKLAQDNGYTMSIYRTKSLLHGLSQVRERSFYFFWKGDKVPVFKYFDDYRVSIEDQINLAKPDSTQQEVTNKKIPSKDDPYYRYVLEVMHGGISHAEFQKTLTKSADAMHYIEENGHNYRMVKSFFEKEGYTKFAAKMDAMQDKLDAGGNIMRRASYIPKDYIGAFVGHLPVSMTHHTEDRYLTYRECMTIMGLPQDFELLNPARNLNHVCQNVPVHTATDMAFEIKAVLEGKRDMMNGSLIYQFNPQKTFEIRDYEPLSSLESFL
jgi:site-specific DNA-cytosine methylase